MNAVIALISAAFLISAVTAAPTVTRVWGFGMTDENETAASQDNSQAATSTQNQLVCLNLDDGWWSPIAGPIAVKACGPTGESSNLQALSKQTETSTTPPSTTETNTETQPTTETSTTSTPPTQTETLAPPSDVTENKNNDGNTVLSSSINDVTITAIVNESSHEIVDIPEVAKQVLEADKKDYVRGLVQGIRGVLKLEYKNTPEELAEFVSDKFAKYETEPTAPYQSDAYKDGLYRGIKMGIEYVDTFVIPYNSSSHK